MTLAAPEVYLQEIIRLQLRKPKNWNWQLSTSKSSPHLSLPIIQLYDSKGQLLLEAKDAAGTERRSWHSLDLNKPKHIITNDEKKAFSKDSLSNRHLQRCRSDTLNRNAKNSLLENIPESIATGRVREVRSSANKLNKSSSAVFDNSIGKRRGADAIGGSAKTTQEPPHNLKKSRSDILQENSNVGAVLKQNSILKSSSSREIQKHRRTRSDDLFGRKMKFSSEESLKRAEEDGYKKFLLQNEQKINENDVVETFANDKKEFGNVHNRYKTRTSSAGTLIITDETFNMQRGRRRHRPSAEPNDDAPPPNSSDAPNSRPTEHDNADESRMENGKRASLHAFRVDDSGSCGRNKLMFDRCNPIGSVNINKPGKNRLEESAGDRRQDSFGGARNCLFYSQSDIFPFEKIMNVKYDNNSNYIVQEPTTPTDKISSRRRVSGGPIIIDAEKVEKKKRKKNGRRHSDASTSSSTVEKKYQGKGKGNGTKAHHVSKDHHHHHHTKKDLVVGNGDSDLLQLVRRLSTDHVKMGANVSRHSSKGLSGRRSQSSGSICNGKGRHEDGKMCGSLPSYLDDRNSTGGGCNNNHDCEKPPLAEVQRIPPLGDGAPLHWKFSDNQTVLCDQGYGSERSPEEEYPPPLPDHDSQCHHHLEPHACYPFITPEATFTVKLSKSSRGLGLSVTGGVDSGGSWPGLIRIKRLFPHQPASACGLLNVGDLIIEANGITLTGLTNYEALEVLRTAPNQVELKVCRPPPDVLCCVSPISEAPPPPPRREHPTILNLPPTVYSTAEDDYYHGEYEIKLTKIQGSLGFTLRKEDDSALGHYVRALVREPALTDGRIRAGDKIIAVNDVEISPMSHEQAVQFLRQCGDVVKLRLYRDSAQTPVAALSPTETTPRTSFSKKTNLRQEAVDMLNDIAVRKMIPTNHDTYRRSTSPTSSPRRLRRQTCPSDASQYTTDSSSKYLISEEQFHEGLLQQGSLPYSDDPLALFTLDSDDGDKPPRPISLDLYNPNQTPVAARKPRFNFSLAHNAYELNNLDADVLDAPNLTYNLGNDDVQSTEVECGNSYPKEPASMPHIPIENSEFNYKNPTYQSVHPPCGTEVIISERVRPPSKASNKSDDSNMKKWKRVVFDGDEETGRVQTSRSEMGDVYEILSIELNRGWNSRLGFSLQGAAGVTYISAVYQDSVAARDGRLKPGDRIIKVNDESVEHMQTNEIIDLLRIVRGPVCIVVSRLKSKVDCPKSNAEN